jgi:hypothetical protein
MDDYFTHIMFTLEQNQSSLEEPGLFSGISGLALTTCYYGHHMNSPRHIAKGEELLEKALTMLDSGEAHIGASFATGLAGIVWTINHLIKSGICKIDAEELLLEADELMYAFSRKELASGKYDYMHDGLGGVLYLLSRSDLPQNRAFLTELLHALLNTVEKLADGWAWKNYRLDAPNGGNGYNLSTAHGSMGVLAILGMYYDCGIEPEVVREACFHICKFIKYALTNCADVRSFVPAVVSAYGQKVFNDRLNWCYGDLGASLILYSTGKRFEWAEISELGLQLGLKESLKRAPIETNIVDSSLCHGYAGAAYIFSKWNQLSFHPQFTAAAHHWNEQILSSVESPLAWDQCRFYSGYQKAFISNYGLLDGLGGTLLSMLAQRDTTSYKKESWDRALLLS